MSDLRTFEKEAIERLLAGDSQGLQILQGQLQLVRVHKRVESTAGFQTEFVLPESAELLPNKSRVVLSNLCADVLGLQGGIGFALFIQAGKLHSLDGSTFEEPWPGERATVTRYRSINSRSDVPSWLVSNED